MHEKRCPTNHTTYHAFNVLQKRVKGVENYAIQHTVVASNGNCSLVLEERGWALLVPFRPISLCFSQSATCYTGNTVN